MVSKKNKELSTFAIRWIARILGLVLIFIVISILVQNGVENPLQLGVPALILNICLLIMMIGILLGFKWELIGGSSIVAGFVIFWLVNIISTGNVWLGWVFPLFPIVGAFFIICSLRSKKSKSEMK